MSGKRGTDLKAYIRDRSLAFARPWFAKDAGKHRGFWSSEGFTKRGILENTMKEFDAAHAKNEQTADPPDKIDAVVDDFLSGLARSVE